MAPAPTQTGWRIRHWDSDPVWEDFPVPDPRPGEVLVEVEACGVGLTVLNAIRGDLGDDPGLLPRVPGHELVGRVAVVGDRADPGLLGRRVVAYFYLVCGICEECLAGVEALCRSHGGYVGVHRDGGYAPWVALPGSNVLPIPEDIDPLAATVIPDAVATPVHVVGRSGIAEGDRVVVIGAGGGVGLHMIQLARLSTSHVVGVDVTEEKLEAIELHGARAVAPPELSPMASLRYSPTVVVDLVGSPETTEWSIAALAGRGRYVALTTFRDSPVPVQHRDLVFREITVMGSRYATKAEVIRAAELVASGRVVPVVGAEAAPPGLPGLHERLRSGRLVGRGAIRWVR